jgi:CheY-like chemotaxis protein
MPGRWLLLVEDNPINREVALELLHGAGLSVDTAADGQQAVVKAGARAYDLILMDTTPAPKWATLRQHI